jgi:hypothetical protein
VGCDHAGGGCRLLRARHHLCVRHRQDVRAIAPRIKATPCSTARLYPRGFLLGQAKSLSNLYAQGVMSCSCRWLSCVADSMTDDDTADVAQTMLRHYGERAHEVRKVNTAASC